MQENTSHNLIVKHHYPEIDGLRGVAVLLVIWFHASLLTHDLLGQPLSGITNYYYALTMLGATGVDLFFVLSGFLITGILIDTHTSKNRYKNFLIRRSLRVFPLYYGFLFLFAFFYLTTENSLAGLGKLGTYIIYMQNWSGTFGSDAYVYLNHTWSLAVEEQFYILWPFVFWGLYKKSSKHVMALLFFLILSSWLLRYSFVMMGEYKSAIAFTICRMDGLALGALASILYKNHKDVLLKLLPLIKVAVIVLLLLLVISSFTHVSESYMNLVKVGMSIACMLYACLILYAVLLPETSRFKSICRWKFLRNTGRVSYGMYLFHWPFCIFFTQTLMMYKIEYGALHLLVLLCTLVLSYITATISYKVFEKPILALKDKYAPQHTG